MMTELIAIKPNSGIIAPACDALGLSRATLHRRCAAAVRPLAVPRPRPTPARALTPPERKRVIDLLREPQYVDLAPAEICATLLDQGKTIGKCTRDCRSRLHAQVDVDH